MKTTILIGLLSLFSLSLASQTETVVRQFTHLDAVYQQDIQVEDSKVVKIVWMVKRIDPVTRTLCVVEESHGSPVDEIEVTKDDSGTYWFNQEYFLLASDDVVRHQSDSGLSFISDEFDWYSIQSARIDALPKP